MWRRNSWRAGRARSGRPARAARIPDGMRLLAARLCLAAGRTGCWVPAVAEFRRAPVAISWRCTRAQSCAGGAVTSPAGPNAHPAGWSGRTRRARRGRVWRAPSHRRGSPPRTDPARLARPRRPVGRAGDVRPDQPPTLVPASSRTRGQTTDQLQPALVPGCGVRGPGAWSVPPVRCGLSAAQTVCQSGPGIWGRWTYTGCALTRGRCSRYQPVRRVPLPGLAANASMSAINPPTTTTAFLGANGSST
jgi:hypothetical protein